MFFKNKARNTMKYGIFSIIIVLSFCSGKNVISSAKKPHIVILATGGTIAGSAESNTAVAGYKAGAIGIQTLINAVPQAKNIADLTGEQVVSIDSQNMNEKIWIKLSHKINKLLSSGEADAVVITHGTDTMEETAYFLNLNIKSSKPVVLVGSMRPATAMSADGPLNLYNAIKVAANPKSVGKGVLVSMNDTIFNARNVTKSNTTRVDTFKDSFLGPIGFIQNGKVLYYTTSNRIHTSKSQIAINDTQDSLPRVDIIYAFAGITKDYVDHALQMGAQGIVIAGMGDGGLGTELTESLSQAQKKGILIVRSSRVGSGIVTHNGDAEDDKLGFISADNLNPQKARILLQLALLQTKDINAIQNIFLTY